MRLLQRFEKRVFGRENERVWARDCDSKRAVFRDAVIGEDPGRDSAGERSRERRERYEVLREERARLDRHRYRLRRRSRGEFWRSLRNYGVDDEVGDYS